MRSVTAFAQIPARSAQASFCLNGSSLRVRQWPSCSTGPQWCEGSVALRVFRINLSDVVFSLVNSHPGASAEGGQGAGLWPLFPPGIMTWWWFHSVSSGVSNSCQKFMLDTVFKSCIYQTYCTRHCSVFPINLLNPFTCTIDPADPVCSENYTLWVDATLICLVLVLDLIIPVEPRRSVHVFPPVSKSSLV